jgi:acyl carrier protein
MTIEDEVFDFVAKERGIKREKLKLSDRLLVDLGMDGDDAVEFFDKFEKKFDVDLTYLEEHWSEYFGPEGISGPGPLLFSITAMVPALGLGIVFHLASWIVVVLGVANLMAAMFVVGSINNRRERKNPTSRQISIADLIDSIRQKSFIVH